MDLVHAAKECWLNDGRGRLWQESWSLADDPWASMWARRRLRGKRRLRLGPGRWGMRSPSAAGGSAQRRWTGGKQRLTDHSAARVVARGAGGWQK
jgi:hypothetical protein